MPRGVLRAFLLVLLLALFGGSAWTIRTLQLQQRQTAGALQQAETLLQEREGALALLEEERQKLAEAYEMLKDRSAKADEELQRLVKDAGALSVQLETASREQTDLEGRLSEAVTSRERLGQEIDGLRHDLAAKEAQQRLAQAQMEGIRQAATQSLTRAELEHVTAVFAEQRAEAQRLRERYTELSNTCERLTQQIRGEQLLLSRRDALSPASEQAASAPPPRARPEESAGLHRQLGELYLVERDYPRAAQAFERSLTFQEDPRLHATLAFLYSRFLHDRHRAYQHAAPAGDQDPTREGLTAVSKSSGLPRSARRLLQGWLSGR